MSRVSKLLQILSNPTSSVKVAVEAAVVLQRRENIEVMNGEMKIELATSVMKKNISWREEQQLRLGKILSAKEAASILSKSEVEKSYSPFLIKLATTLTKSTENIPWSPNLIKSMSTLSYIKNNNWISRYCSNIASSSYGQKRLFEQGFSDLLATTLTHTGIQSPPDSFLIPLTKACSGSDNGISNCLNTLLIFPKTSPSVLKFVSTVSENVVKEEKSDGTLVLIKITLKCLLLSSRRDCNLSRDLCGSLYLRLEDIFSKSCNVLSTNDLTEMLVVSKRGGLYRSDVIYLLCREIQKRNIDSRSLSNTNIADMSSVLTATCESRRELFLMMESQINFQTISYKVLRKILLSFSSALVTHPRPLFLKARKCSSFKKIVNIDRAVRRAFDLAGVAPTAKKNN